MNWTKLLGFRDMQEKLEKEQIIFGQNFEILFIVYSWHLLQLRVKDNVMMKYLQMQQYAARIELLCIQFSVTFYNALRNALVAYELIHISNLIV